MDKRWLFLGAPVIILLVLFAAVIFVLPFFLNADAFRPTIEGQLSAALGRTVSMGKLQFSLLHGTLMAEDVAISDDPSFSSVPFLQAKRLQIGVETFPFLFHKEVAITDLTLDTPSIQLIQHANGRWNYSTLGSNDSPSAHSQTTASGPGIHISELKVINGSALVSSIPETTKSFEFSELTLTAKPFSFQQSFPFEVTGKLPANGTLNMTGEAGPISPRDVSQTPFHAKLQLREFDPVAGGMIERSKGISMVDDVDADLSSDGVTFNATGKVKASQLQLAPKGSPSLEPVDIDFTFARNVATREGNLSDVSVHSGTAVAHVKGSIKSSKEGSMLDLHLSAPALPLEQIDRLLPVVGIRLPSGSSLHGGTLTANIAITGPATEAIFDGPVEIDNTSLAGFDVKSSSEGLSLPSKPGDLTEIRVLKATVHSSPQGTRLSGIYGDLPQYGTATGDGSVAPAGELDFRLDAKLYTSPPPATQAAKNSGLVESSLRLNPKAAQVPTRSAALVITGTPAAPVISARPVTAH